MAGWKLSIVAVVTFWAVSLVFLWTMLKITQKKGEAFLPSGEGIRMANLDEGLSEDCLPGLLPSILPFSCSVGAECRISGICSKGIICRLHPYCYYRT
mgnify:CR=1 FL=1